MIYRREPSSANPPLNVPGQAGAPLRAGEERHDAVGFSAFLGGEPWGTGRLFTWDGGRLAAVAAQALPGAR